MRLVLLACAIATAACAGPRAQSPVYVLGTLYRRHQEVPAYGLAELRRIVTAIDPDVLVLDVTPKELRERKVWPGKIEYPGAIFPLIQRRHRVYPAEPDEPMFSEIVQAGSEARRAFAAARPDAAAAVEQLSAAAYAGLYHPWRSPADVNDELTQRVLAGKSALERALVGPAAKSGAERWNQHTADVVRRAAAENPGRRILVLIGVENRAEVNAWLARAPGVELVDVERWLRERATQKRLSRGE